MRLLARFVAVVLAATAVLALLSAPAADACTSAVILPAGSASGGPVLWKNRDTGTLSNKVVYVAAEPLPYLCLTNAHNPSGRSCFAGLNSAGFGIINTVAYNLPAAADGELADLEGFVMADALRTCRTVADFAAWLAANQGPELGSQTNFGVIDGQGGAMLFETHNHGYEAVDPAKATTSCLVNTNYARTGEAGTGAGYLRFERASDLFAGLPAGPADFATVLTRFTRDTGHVLVDQPTPFELAGVPADRPLWVNTRDCINRVDTADAVVLVGRDPTVPGSLATMWVIPGEPVTAVAVPLWVEAGASPEVLWQGEEAAMWQASTRLKQLARPFSETDKEHYLDLTVLDNAAGTGFLPGLLAVEQAILSDTRAFLGQARSPDELRAFQQAAAARALAALEAAAARRR